MDTLSKSRSPRKQKLIVDEWTHLCFPTLDYAQELFELIEQQRTYLERHLPWIQRIQDLTQVHSFLKEAMLLNRGQQRLTTFIIYKGLLVGGVSLLAINYRDKRAEIGYWLREDMQGMGIMTKSCNRLIQYAFKGLHLNRLEMCILTDNIRSKKIPHRLNFSLEGRKRAYHLNESTQVFEDVEVFGLLKKDWMENN